MLIASVGFRPKQLEIFMRITGEEAHLEFFGDGDHSVLVLVHDCHKDVARGGQLLPGRDGRLGVGLGVGLINAHDLSSGAHLRAQQRVRACTQVPQNEKHASGVTCVIWGVMPAAQRRLSLVNVSSGTHTTGRKRTHALMNVLACWRSTPAEGRDKSENDDEVLP